MKAGKEPIVMVIDDEPSILKTMTICLQELGVQVHGFTKPQEAMRRLPGLTVDIAFVDLKMQPLNGMEVLQQIKRQSPQTTVVIITAHGAIESAVEAIKKGAYDYLQKPFDYAELQTFALNTLAFHQLQHPHQQTGRGKPGRLSAGFITANAQMQEMMELALRVAKTDLGVLIEGESGTGKELVAEALVQNSTRANQPFIRVNCSALPEALLESELFGHVKGAFTGAIKDRAGRFEMADGGTLFLDEISELPLPLQSKLLRVLQRQEFERVGESKTQKTNTRIIAATNRNLLTAISNGLFREDLYYRLNTMRLSLLPLRERPEDIPLLAHHFLRRFSGDPAATLSTGVLKILTGHPWPGNVRELENALKRAVALAGSPQDILPADLPPEILSGTGEASPHPSLEELEKQHIISVLQQSGDLAEAARILGIDPATLWRKRRKYNL